MASIPAKSASRITAGLKKFQPILQSARDRDVNESDTVVLVTDILQEVFGYDKYTEITSEHMIKSTFCDLAIKIDNALQLLLEVKAIGMDLKDSFVKQAVDYAANQGTDWVVLTNSIVWRAYKIAFKKPIEHDLVVEIDLLNINPKNEDELELILLLSKDGWQRDRLADYHTQKQALSRFSLSAVMLSDSVIAALRKELKALSPQVKIDADAIRHVLETEVIKREVLEGEKADAARQQIAKVRRQAARRTKSTTSDEIPADVEAPATPQSTSETADAAPPDAGGSAVQ